jgi:hypothetical protein
MNQLNRSNDGERGAMTWEGLLRENACPAAFFNDDDIYLYCVFPLLLHKKTISCNNFRATRKNISQRASIAANGTWEKGRAASIPWTLAFSLLNLEK